MTIWLNHLSTYCNYPNVNFLVKITLFQYFFILPPCTSYYYDPNLLLMLALASYTTLQNQHWPKPVTLKLDSNKFTLSEP